MHTHTHARTKAGKNLFSVIRGPKDLLSHTTHIHTHTYTLSLSVCLCLSVCLSVCLSFSLPLPPSLSLPLPSLSLSLSLSLTHTRLGDYSYQHQDQHNFSLIAELNAHLHQLDSLWVAESLISRTLHFPMWACPFIVTAHCCESFDFKLGAITATGSEYTTRAGWFRSRGLHCHIPAQHHDVLQVLWAQGVRMPRRASPCVRAAEVCAHLFYGVHRRGVAVRTAPVVWFSVLSE